MIDNSKENIPNRKKVNYKNYKELCKELDLPLYPRGAKRNEQIKMLEETRNIFKKADNSFTQINEDFKPKKQEQHDNYVEKTTLTIDNHSVYLGTRKYYFNRFKNMKTLFLDFIQHSQANTQKQYLEDFFKSCFYFNCYTLDDEFKKGTTNNKIKRIVHTIFMDQIYEIFNQMLNQTKSCVYKSITYIGLDKTVLDTFICEKARKEINETTNIKWYLSERERSKYYAEINELLTSWEEKPIAYKLTNYYLYCDVNSENIDYITDMTKLYEILRYDIIRQLENITVYAPLGIAHVKDYQLSEKGLEEAKAYVKEYVCYYDTYQKKKYYSEEDIA